MDFDDSGVPYLRDKDIEQIAYRLLRKVAPSCLETPETTPIPKILTYLQQNHDLIVIHEDDLGYIDGRKIRGKTRLKEGVIVLDADMLVNHEGMYFMTAGHEIGHWALHRKRKIVKNDKGEIAENFEDDEFCFWDKDELIVVRKKKVLRTALDRVEHQAKVFAANLLMPREPFIKAVTALQYHLGVSQHLGQIYLNDYKNNYYHRLVIMLQELFKVSKQALSVRFRELGILIDMRGKKIINKEAIRTESLRREQEREQEWRR